jgi:hypothetical protein
MEERTTEGLIDTSPPLSQGRSTGHRSEGRSPSNWTMCRPSSDGVGSPRADRENARLGCRSRGPASLSLAASCVSRYRCFDRSAEPKDARSRGTAKAVSRRFGRRQRSPGRPDAAPRTEPPGSRLRQLTVSDFDAGQMPGRPVVTPVNDAVRAWGSKAPGRPRHRRHLASGRHDESPNRRVLAALLSIGRPLPDRTWKLP